jgi:hypothetical protein
VSHQESHQLTLDPCPSAMACDSVQTTLPAFTFTPFRCASMSTNYKSVSSQVRHERYRGRYSTGLSSVDVAISSPSLIILRKPRTPHVLQVSLPQNRQVPETLSRSCHPRLRDGTLPAHRFSESTPLRFPCAQIHEAQWNSV